MKKVFLFMVVVVVAVFCAAPVYAHDASGYKSTKCHIVQNLVSKLDLESDDDEEGDRIIGGQGKYLLYGEDTNDQIIGEQKRDKIIGEHGVDSIYGEDSRDQAIDSEVVRELIKARIKDFIIKTEESCEDVCEEDFNSCWEEAKSWVDEYACETNEIQCVLNCATKRLSERNRIIGGIRAM